MACLFLLVIRFSLHVPCDVFTITNEDNHVETDQTNLANDQLAKQNASGIHDIFYLDKKHKNMQPLIFMCEK